MKKNVVAPSVGESITEVSILKWNKQHGQSVKVGDLLLEIESDKATVEIVAEQNGVLQILKQAGDRIPIGEIVAVIDDSLTPSVSTAPVAPTAGSIPPPPPSAGSAKPTIAPPVSVAPSPTLQTPPPMPGLSPSVRRASVQHNVDVSHIEGSGKDGRVTKGDVLNAVANPPRMTTPSPQPPSTPSTAVASAPRPDKPGERRVPMSMLRQKIAERLVHAQHTAAILTTFNEVDMSAVMKLRAEHKDAFKAKHGVNLSFMSFFAKASVAALKLIPEVNASIDGKDIIYHDFFDIGIAVGTDRGLVVPVVRGLDQMSFVEIEKKIGELAIKGRDGKLSIADLSGGTFTISNGGTYGSLLSTPILNPPQSGILGMHKIMDRPIAVNGTVQIRPMMYLALSYDHRIIDGKGAVTFLVHLKEHLENPEKLGLTY